MSTSTPEPTEAPAGELSGGEGPTSSNEAHKSETSRVEVIYEEEADFIEKHGASAWFSGDFDPYSVIRQRHLPAE